MKPLRKKLILPLIGCTLAGITALVLYVGSSPSSECDLKIGEGMIGKTGIEIFRCSTLFHEYEESLALYSDNWKTFSSKTLKEPLGYVSPEHLGAVRDKESESLKFHAQPIQAEFIDSVAIKIKFVDGSVRDLSLESILGSTTPITSVKALIESAKSGKLSLIQILNLEDINLNAGDAEGTTVLHWIAAHGNVELASYVLQSGANVNAKRITGGTPLMSAAYSGDTFMINLLLKYGADPSLKNKNGLTAYDIALKEKRTFAAELLRVKN